jgi:hypothetical protein
MNFLSIQPITDVQKACLVRYSSRWSEIRDLRAIITSMQVRDAISDSTVMQIYASADPITQRQVFVTDVKQGSQFNYHCFHEALKENEEHELAELLAPGLYPTSSRTPSQSPAVPAVLSTCIELTRAQTDCLNFYIEKLTNIVNYGKFAKHLPKCMNVSGARTLSPMFHLVAGIKTNEQFQGLIQALREYGNVALARDISLCPKPLSNTQRAYIDLLMERGFQYTSLVPKLPEYNQYGRKLFLEVMYIDDQKQYEDLYSALMATNQTDAARLIKPGLNPEAPYPTVI